MMLCETEVNKLFESLQYDSFYEDFGEVFSQYGQKSRWMGRSPQQRVTHDSVDGEVVEAIINRLERYDQANGLVRFFQRLFTPIEKQRSLLCYWAVESLRKNVNYLDVLTFLSPKENDLSPPALHQTATHQVQALLILRLHAARLTSVALRGPLKRWGLSLELNLPSVWRAWSYLRDICLLHKNGVDSNVSVITNQQDALVKQELNLLLRTTAEHLRSIYVNPGLSQEIRAKNIEDVRNNLSQSYAQLIDSKTDISQEMQVALKEIYRSNLEKIELEKAYYNKRLTQSKKHLEAIGSVFKEKPQLPLLEQWSKQHYVDISERFQLAKNLLQQAFPTPYYSEVKHNIHAWLNAYLQSFFEYYLNAFKVTDGHHLSEDREPVLAPSQALCKQIQECLQENLRNLFAHETQYPAVLSKIKLSDLASHHNWFLEWQNVLSTVLTFSAEPKVAPMALTDSLSMMQMSEQLSVTTTITVSSRVVMPATQLSIDELIEDTLNEVDEVEVEPKSIEAWQQQFETDMEKFTQQQTSFIEKIKKTLEVGQKDQVQTMLEECLRTLEKTYREFSRVYHPDRLKDRIAHISEQEKIKFANEKFALLNHQKDMAIESLQMCVKSMHIAESKLSSIWQQSFLERIQAMNQILRRMDQKATDIFESYREMQAVLQTVAVEQKNVRENQQRIAEDQIIQREIIDNSRIRIDRLDEAFQRQKEVLQQQSFAVEQQRESFQQQTQQNFAQLQQQIQQSLQQQMSQIEILLQARDKKNEEKIIKNISLYTEKLLKEPSVAMVSRSIFFAPARVATITTTTIHDSEVKTKTNDVVTAENTP